MNSHNTLRSYLTKRRATEAGVTLIEVMIVVAIMAMIAAGVAFGVMPRYRDAQIKAAQTGARTFRQAVQSWQMTNNETRCPTVAELLEGKHIDAATDPKDPWGQEYHMQCTQDEVVVSSDGPDKKSGTKDDIVIPAGVNASES